MQRDHFTATRFNQNPNDNFGMTHSTPDLMLIQHENYRIIFSVITFKLIIQFHHIFDKVALESNDLSSFGTQVLINFLLGDRPHFSLPCMHSFLPCLSCSIFSDFFFRPFLFSFVGSVVRTVFVVQAFRPFVYCACGKYFHRLTSTSFCHLVDLASF